MCGKQTELLHIFLKMYMNLYLDNYLVHKIFY
jgi:hypothetical protein